jgi:DNA-binding response OmpR family regulator
MRTLWLSSSETDLLQQGANAWPRFDKVEHIDWPQAIGRLRSQSAPNNTIWVLQVGGLNCSPAGLRQGLLEAKMKVWVVVLLPFDRCSEIVEWLNAGADRCVALPCQPALLAALLRSLHRRSFALDCGISQFASLSFDHAAMTLFCNEHRVALTQREAQVMSVLMQRVGKIVSNQEISLHMAHGESCVLRPAAVQLYVHRINRKIEPYGLHVHCVKQVGYGLAVKPQRMPNELSTVWGCAAVSAHRPFPSLAAHDNAHAHAPWV